MSNIGLKFNSIGATLKNLKQCNIYSQLLVHSYDLSSKNSSHVYPTFVLLLYLTVQSFQISIERRFFQSPTWPLWKKALFSSPDGNNNTNLKTIILSKSF